MNRLRRLRSNLTYANVVATIALVVAISGGATAIAITASKNSVTTKSIRSGAVRASDLGSTVVRTGHGSGQATALCAKGERVLGGGGTVDGADPALSALKKSHPSGSGWFVLAGQTGPGTLTTTAYAICLRR
jgi:hypothetical protein